MSWQRIAIFAVGIALLAVGAAYWVDDAMRAAYALEWLPRILAFSVLVLGAAGIATAFGYLVLVAGNDKLR